MISQPIRKFEKSVKLYDYEILTESGWKNLKNIGITEEYEEYEITTENGLKLICADDHIVFTKDGQCFTKNLIPKESIIETKYGYSLVVSLIKNGQFSNMFDVEVDSPEHSYYTNDILSHNSIILGNLATNLHLNGVNTLLLSNEMKINKLYRRISANVLNIDISELRNISNDPESLALLFKEFREKNFSNLIPVGDLKGQRYSKLSPSKVSDIVHKYEDTSGKKVGAVVIDYFTDMDNDHGYTLSNAYESYAYHKSNSVDLFNIANDDKLAMISAHQLKVKGYGLPDVDLSMLGESSGIQHKIDNVFGIIQPPEMKTDRKYLIKNLKGRESEYKNWKFQLEIDYNHMRLKDTGISYEPSDFMV